MTTKRLQEKLAALPEVCGVYLMKDRHAKVIYVGKAVNLRARVRSYFHASSDERVFVEHLVPRVADIDWVIVANEKEALILENNLIKQFKPRFNINLKDDKTFLSLRLDRRQPFPRLELVRRFSPEEGVHYFGPYSSAAAARETLRVVNAIFPLRKCSDAVFRNRLRPCLYYELGRCVAPCVGHADAAAYGQLLDEAEMFLRGRSRELAERLRQKMLAAAARQEYEMAAKHRDQLAAVERTIERQVVSSPESVDRDVFGFYVEGHTMQVQALLVRHGKIEDVPTYDFHTRGLRPETAFAEFLKQFYGRTRFIPAEVLVPTDSPDLAPLAEWLSERRGGQVHIIRPQRGFKARLVEMAARNAESAYRAAHTGERDRAEVLHKLQARLGLLRLPKRMECYDISNLGGSQAVGSQVTFDNGVPNKARYRRYRIKCVEGIDDFAMMREVLTRRLRRGREAGDLPNLMIVDGGKGQLGAALQAIRDTGVSGVEVIALAKGRDPGSSSSHRTRQAAPPTEQRVFVPGHPEAIVLESASPELHLLEQIRDEAHRFALAFHRKLRRKPFQGSILDRIPGIGPARKKALVAHFGSVRAIRAASVEELLKVEGISARQAELVHAFFHGSGEQKTQST